MGHPMDCSRGILRDAGWLPLAALAVSLAAGCMRQAQHAPDVWAVVNGKEIKRDEVDKYYRTRVNPEGQEPSEEEALSLKLNVLDELIYNEILLERAKKLGLEATDGEVEDKFTERKSPYTEEEFQRQLREQGMTVDDWKQDMRRQLSIQDYYSGNKAQFNFAEPTYHLAQVVVTPRKDPQIRNRKNDDATNESEALRKTKMLMDRLSSGADFAQLAMDYSEDMNTVSTGGDLGYVPESALNSQQVDPALKRAVLALKPGQVSQPIEARDQAGVSYRILKLISREAAGQRSLSEPQVQQNIRDTLRSRKEQLLRSAYLAIARDDAQVTNYLAQQVIEAGGKLPEAAKTYMPPRSIGH